MDPIEAAIDFLKSLPPGEQPNFSKVAKEFNVNRSTLSRRFRGETGSKSKKYEQQRLLNDIQEKDLQNYVDSLCERGLPPTHQMLANFAKEISGEEPGIRWAERFVKRHNIDLVSRWSDGIDTNRKRADSAFKYSLYFELLRRKIKQYKIHPRNIYNMDEKGFLIGVLARMKRIFSRRRYEDGGVKQFIQDGNREWITSIACICADGTALSPTLIYQAISGYIRDTWLESFDPEEHSCFFVSSPSGWTNDKLGFQWLERVFHEETKGKARGSYRLLILDGHGSHVTMKFIDFCDKHRILLAIYPPHSTHTLQPLDVALFKPLSVAYSKNLADFMAETEGFSAITKRNFFTLFWPAWNASFTQKNILSGFRCTGLHPFKPDVIIAKFSDSDAVRPSSSESSNSILKAEDWRRIEKLLSSAVSNIFSKEAQRLSNTVHSLTTSNLLLQMENNTLKKRLGDERKRRKRGKALILKPPEDGGAVFYSPKKVQLARDLAAQKQAEEQATRQQKEEDKLQKEEKKKEKQKLLELRKITRANNKELKLQAQEKKRQEEEELDLQRQASKQLLDDQRLSKRAHKPPKSPRKRNPVIPVETIEEDVVVSAEPAVSKRGRQITLPARFRN